MTKRTLMASRKLKCFIEADQVLVLCLARLLGSKIKIDHVQTDFVVYIPGHDYRRPIDSIVTTPIAIGLCL